MIKTILTVPWLDRYDSTAQVRAGKTDGSAEITEQEDKFIVSRTWSDIDSANAYIDAAHDLYGTDFTYILQEINS
jgi:hypothetical protein